MDSQALRPLRMPGAGDTPLIGAGWKSVSLVDVADSATFTLWLCGCNLRCPFCHNWRLASLDPERCRPLDIRRLLEALDSAKAFVDYLHVTGGEPLLQWRPLMELLATAKESLGMRTSINTNLTLVEPLRRMAERGVVDHVATDLKVPPEAMTGLEPRAAAAVWGMFREGLEVVAQHGLRLELRVPVARFTTPDLVLRYVREVEPALRKVEGLVIVVQPLLGEPVTEPRSRDWCRLYCNPGPEALDSVAEAFRSLGFEARVRKWLGS